jgi:hypothetical protein
VVLALLAWVGWGVHLLWRRPGREPAPPGEIRGAWHVHTERSDGRGSLADVVSAARDAGLQFVVIADHNVLTPAEAGYHDGILVLEATEVSAKFGHIVALGIERELTKEERLGEPLKAIDALGGEAIAAHPLHRKRPWLADGTRDWLGWEVVSNDTLWHDALAPWGWPRLVQATIAIPFDRTEAVLALYRRPEGELARFDALNREEPKYLFCSVDAHGWPTYRSAFEAFSMHLPISLSGDVAKDTEAVRTALTDGQASCVFDGVASAWGARLETRPGVLRMTAPERGGEFRLFGKGEAIGANRDLPIAPGRYRVEATLGGRPWIFTNPVDVE